MTASKRRAVVVSLAAAALALVPVPLGGYDDGCNRHFDGRYPLVTVPFILVLKP